MNRQGLRSRRGAVASVGVALCAAVFSTAGSPTAGAATVLTFSPLPHRMESALQGSLCQSPNTCTEVDYDFSMPVSVSRITTAINTATSTPPGSESGVIVFGLSGGAGAAAKWMRNHAADVDAPSPDVLSFVLIGNPGRKYGGSSRRFAADPVTQYQVIDIAQQYDPIADSPDDPFNLLAHLNVMAGLLSPLHTDYSEVDINDPRNIRWVEGNTTYILVPTDDLPLTYALRAFGLGALADSLDGRLREIIERGYNRPAEVDAALELLREPSTTPPPTDGARIASFATTTAAVDVSSSNAEVSSATGDDGSADAAPSQNSNQRKSQGPELAIIDDDNRPDINVTDADDDTLVVDSDTSASADADDEDSEVADGSGPSDPVASTETEADGQSGDGDDTDGDNQE